MDVVVFVVGVTVGVSVVGVTRMWFDADVETGGGAGARRLRLPLASQLVVVQLIVIGAVLLAVSAVSVEITRLGFARDEGRRVLTLAENLAANPVVRSEDVDRGRCGAAGGGHHRSRP